MKMKLAVLFGGRSCEHDVSIITGVQAMHNADPARYDVIPVYIGRDGLWYSGDALREVSFLQNFDAAKVTRCILSGRDLVAWPPKKKGLFSGNSSDVLAQIDVAMPCFHGLNGEDGTVQGLLELNGVPYTSGGVLGSAVSMDKIAQKMMLRGCGLPVLPMCWFDRTQWQRERDKVLDKIESELEAYPLFVKPANLGSSIGITRATDRETLAHAIDVAAAFDRRILVETGIESPMEVNCSGLGFAENVEASVCEMPVAWQEFLTFEDKYLRNGKGAKDSGAKGGMANLQRKIPAPISEKMTALIQEATVDIFKILDLKGVVRIDFMIDPATGNFYVNEVNTIPGSLSFYLWEPKGLIFARLIDKMVDYAFAAHKEQEASSYSYDSGVLKGYTGGKTAK